MTTKTWSVAIDNEQNGFADDPVHEGLALVNSPAVIPHVGAVHASFSVFPTAAAGPSSIAYDDIIVSAPGDTTPPAVVVPPDATADATSPAGSVVSYEASATGNHVDGPVPVARAPPSGSVFPIGDTIVECEASDSAGNTAEASFNVHVKGATRADRRPEGGRRNVTRRWAESHA